MASILGDGTGPGGPGTSRCLLLLQRSLAIQLSRGPPSHIANASQRESPKEHPADEMWMYDKGYNLFQVSRVIFVLFISLFIYHWYFSIASSCEFELFSIFVSKRYAFLTFPRFFLLRRSRRRKSFAEANVGTEKENATSVGVETSLFVSSALFLPPVSTHGSFTVKRTLIARTVTPQWDNVNYEQFRKSKHNRGAAG